MKWLNVKYKKIRRYVIAVIPAARKECAVNAYSIIGVDMSFLHVFFQIQ